MGKRRTQSNQEANRRSFLKGGLVAAGAGTGAGLLSGDELSSVPPTSGDAAIWHFQATVEILEMDFWVQYNELGGVQDSEVPGGTGNTIYTAKLANLDANMAPHIHDNTEDEFTDQKFLNAYLASKVAATVNLERFRTAGRV